jgi:acetylornithine aminotransferase
MRGLRVNDEETLTKIVNSAASEVCDILEEHKDSGLLDETIIYFETKLKEFYENHKNIFYKEVGLGLMRGLRVNDEETLTKIVNSAFDKGVLVLKAGKITLRFLPPLTINKNEINEGFKRLEDAVQSI